MLCKHRWNEDPPVAGQTFCTECGHVHTGKGRKKGSKNGKASTITDSSSLSAIAGEIIGVSDSRATPDSPESVDGFDGGSSDGADDGSLRDHVAVHPTPRWCATAGRRLSRLFVDSIEWANERFRKRRANEPDEEDVKEFGEALGESLGQWFPDSELTPGKKALIAGLAIGATMSVGAKKIEAPKPVPSVTSNAGPNGVAPTPEVRPVGKGGAPRVPTSLFPPESF